MNNSQNTKRKEEEKPNLEELTAVTVNIGHKEIFLGYVKKEDKKDYPVLLTDSEYGLVIAPRVNED